VRVVGLAFSASSRGIPRAFVARGVVLSGTILAELLPAKTYSEFVVIL
jgi:hypothetical protein